MVHMAHPVLRDLLMFDQQRVMHQQAESGLGIVMYHYSTFTINFIIYLQHATSHFHELDTIRGRKQPFHLV